MRTRLVLPLLAVVAIGAAVYAERPAVHVAEYRLPDGGVARVRYTGDVAPRLAMVPTPPAPSVAAFDRFAAMMDAQAEAFHGAMALDDVARRQAAEGAEPTLAALADAPAGARWSSVSSTSVGGKVCTTEVSSVSRGAGKAPVTVRRMSGACGGAAAAAVAPPTPTPRVGVPRDSI